MGLEQVALMALLGQVMHQLQHASDNAKDGRLKVTLAPIISAIRAAISDLASS